MALVTQASKFPTRKIMAVIISGMITGVAQSLLRLFWPDHPFAPYMESVDIWLQGLIMVYVGYMTKDSANEPVDETSGLQKPDLGGDSQLSFDPLWDGEKEGGQVGGGEQGSQGQGKENK